MTISVLDRLKLGKELSDLMQAQKTAPVLQRVTIGKQIVDVMLNWAWGLPRNRQRNRNNRLILL
ncbi:Uncharacterised protein [Escherichia coli]|uniref:hypothetical protein n=1 Tax=Escherichia coli TaxID=562 RepID=UPI000E026D4D|nr:hypothetical protein [Escherichia coli]STO98915.1 Uncharacterised protein [Escherichia coli]